MFVIFLRVCDVILLNCTNFFARQSRSTILPRETLERIKRETVSIVCCGNVNFTRRWVSLRQLYNSERAVTGLATIRGVTRDPFNTRLLDNSVWRGVDNLPIRISGLL